MLCRLILNSRVTLKKRASASLVKTSKEKEWKSSSWMVWKLNCFILWIMSFTVGVRISATFSLLYSNWILFQTIHISLEYSITPSSPLAPSSHHPPISVCCLHLQGSCRATYRRAAVCLHGKHAALHHVSVHDRWHEVISACVLTTIMWMPRFENISLQLASSLTNILFTHRDTYSDRSGSSTPDSEISELKLPSITNEWPGGTLVTDELTI